MPCTSIRANSQRVLRTFPHFTAEAAEIQRGAAPGLRSHSGLGVGPPSCSPNPGPGWQLHSPAAPDPLPASARGPEDRTFARSLAPPRGAPVDASIAPRPVQLSRRSSCRRPARPPQRRSAHLRTRAAPVAPPLGHAPFPPTRPGRSGRSGPASASSRCPRDFRIRASRRGRGVAWGRGVARGGAGRGIACRLQLRLSPAFPAVQA